MIHSFLLIGQSNMAGRGILSEAIPIDSSHIKILRNGRWQNMFRPINPDRPFSGVSLAESFAEAYAVKHDCDVGLICCADGGTSLEQWQPGSLLFENAVTQAKLAQRTSTIVGILWHQGESDCYPHMNATYQERFEPILHGIREELNLPDIPFLVGGLGDYLAEYNDPALHNYPIINQALVKITEENHAVGFVSAEGLTSNDDRLHFNSKSLYEFGLRYLTVYEKMAGDITLSGLNEKEVRGELESL
ncbi:MAG: sialate O-acetylesterase [Clostridia bacterium]|nr:sialate O-acetylesterase [Clostridia bacterium]